jgi:hypothetical protein
MVGTGLAGEGGRGRGGRRERVGDDFTRFHVGERGIVQRESRRSSWSDTPPLRRARRRAGDGEGDGVS